MSLSNDLDNKSNGTIVSKLNETVQISGEEKLQLEISKLNDPNDRAACTAMLDYACEDRIRAGQELRIVEDAYVGEHLKPEPTLDLNPIPDERSYEMRVHDLRQEFWTSEEGRRLAQDHTDRLDALVERVAERIELCRTHEQRPDLSREDFDRLRSHSGLQRDFVKAKSMNRSR